MSPRTTASAADVFVGSRIKELREQKGLRQETLCDQLNISQQQLSRYEAGETSIPVSHVLVLIDTFGTTPDIFFEFYIDKDNKTGRLDYGVISIAKQIQSIPPRTRGSITSLIATLLPDKRKPRPKS